ncbi:MAG: nucleoside recognition domain-containing protein [Bacillota bacterium]|nr:nucleoside recognition domain-containing protein [Bacillota bacterium]
MEAISTWGIPCLLLLIPLAALRKGLPVYELFVSGAAEGARLCLGIFPNLLAMLLVIGLFRESGALAALSSCLTPLFDRLGVPAEVLPLALLRPLSGSGALAATADIIQTCGPDSFPGFLASVMQGSTDTTCYVLAVYFGSVGIKKYGNALSLGLAADLFSFISAFVVCRILFPM